MSETPEWLTNLIRGHLKCPETPCEHWRITDDGKGDWCAHMAAVLWSEIEPPEPDPRMFHVLLEGPCLIANLGSSVLTLSDKAEPDVLRTLTAVERAVLVARLRGWADVAEDIIEERILSGERL